MQRHVCLLVVLQIKASLPAAAAALKDCCILACCVHHPEAATGGCIIGFQCCTPGHGTLASPLSLACIKQSTQINNVTFPSDCHLPAQQVKRALGGRGTLQRLWGPTLYHRDDIPFDIDATPDVFTPFKNKVWY